MKFKFAGLGAINKPATVEWLTPPRIIAALGAFDLDPCAPVDQPFPTAARTFSRKDNGLLHRWDGRVWLNPPYSHGIVSKWLARMADHDRGTALIFARTDTEAFHRYVFERASALLFMAGRLNFHLPDGSEAPGNAGAPTVLCAYGANDADVLAACEIAGQFVPLRISRSVLVSIFATSNESEKIDITWREVIDEFAEQNGGVVLLDELYRFVRAHPKSATNRHPEAKARQQLQRGGYRRVERGLWEATR